MYFEQIIHRFGVTDWNTWQLDSNLILAIFSVNDTIHVVIRCDIEYDLLLQPIVMQKSKHGDLSSSSLFMN